MKESDLRGKRSGVSGSRLLLEVTGNRKLLIPVATVKESARRLSFVILELLLDASAMSLQYSPNSPSAEMRRLKLGAIEKGEHTDFSFLVGPADRKTTTEVRIF